MKEWCMNEGTMESMNDGMMKELTNEGMMRE